jgi:hypothetical protein
VRKTAVRAKLENFMVDGNVEEEDLTDNNKLRIGAVASVFICGRGRVCGLKSN